MGSPGKAPLSISLKLSGVAPLPFTIHDLRFYEGKLPDNIDPSRTHLNKVLYASRSLPSTGREVEEWLEALEQEAREKFAELKKEGKVAKNQGWKVKSPLIYGILGLSHEAQERVRDEERLEEFLKEATEYLNTLSRALGTDLVYAVVHKDETAPHVHFAMFNLRYKDPDMEAVRRLGWEDLSEKLTAGTGKAVSSTFSSIAERRQKEDKKKKQREYRISLSRLQDSLDFFNHLGMGRGIPKRERIARGEPRWKWTSRSVKKLHYDLPAEIRAKEEELKKVEAKLREAEERMKEGKEALKRFVQEKMKEVGLKTETVGVVRKREVYDAQTVRKLLGKIVSELAGAGSVVAQAQRLEENLSEVRRELLEARKERERLEEEAERLRKEIDRLRKVEAELKRRQKPEEELGQEQKREQEQERRRRWKLRGPGL